MRGNMYQQRTFQKNVFQIGLPLSLLLFSATVQAALPINSVNDGRIIQGGTYGNTADKVTTFKNSAGGGLWLQGGQSLRGVEVDPTGKLTRNGGTFHLYAPGQVVRLEGNIDIRGQQSTNGAFIGNGGRVFIDSAYLFQNGNIFASGINGGMVQFNVGSLTLGPTARIMALGYGGQGGVVSINASGAVDLQRGSMIETSGKVSGMFDTNVINIEGSLVNIEGTLQANGIQSRGGTVRLVSTGQTDLNQTQSALLDANAQHTFNSSEIDTHNGRLNTLKANYEGSIRIASTKKPTEQQVIINTQGMLNTTIIEGNDRADLTPRAGDGGTILITAQNRILNGGWLLAGGAQGLSGANGGNGGTINLNAGTDLITSGRITAGGGSGGDKGGTGGLIAFNYRDGLSNTGTILALGGQAPRQGGRGGLIVFAGNNSPLGNGSVLTMGGPGQSSGSLGSIVVNTPNAPQSQTLRGNLKQLSGVEALGHAENLIILSSKNPSAYVDENGHTYAVYLAYAQMRTVQAPNDDVVKLTSFGDSYRIRNQAAVNEIDAKRDPMLSSNPDPYYFRNFIFTNSNTRWLEGRSDTLARADVLKQLNTVTINNQNSRIDATAWANPFGNGPAGGHFSLIAKDVETVNASLNPGSVSGGSINIALSGSIDSGLQGNLNGKLHGGSVISKSTPSRLSLQYDTNGGLMGGSQQIFARTLDSATLNANGSLTGGSIYLHNQRMSNPDRLIIQAKGGLYGGTIQARFNEPIDSTNPSANVSGSVQNGKVSITSNP